MPLSVGDTLPEATFLTPGDDGPQEVTTASVFGSGKSVLFGMPGAFTGTCSQAHVPSILQAMDGLKGKGVGTVAILTVNDPFVVEAWADATGAAGAGIVMLADPEAAFTKAAGMEFSFPPRGLIDRSRRFAAIVEDGKVVHLDVEDSPGTCDLTGGMAILEKV